MKNISFMLTIILLVFTACQKKTETITAVPVNIDSLIAHPSQYVNQTIQVEGTAVHVCRHTGKRLFLADSKGENRFKLVTGKSISKFDVAWEGSEVLAEGIVKEQRIDEAYLAAKESNIKTESKEEFQHTGEHKGETEEEDDAVEAQLKQIQNLRRQLKESGKDHLSFYSLECNKIEVKNAE